MAMGCTDVHSSFKAKKKVSTTTTQYILTALITFTYSERDSYHNGKNMEAGVCNAALRRTVHPKMQTNCLAPHVYDSTVQNT